jgi:hypothetical protein
MSPEHGCERLSHDQPIVFSADRPFPTVNYWIDFARHVLAERGAICPGERRGGLSGAGGSSFAKGEAQQRVRRGQRNPTQTGNM